MVASYGLFGVFANIVALVNQRGPHLRRRFRRSAATLTLPGIAGIVLTIGMAVDANVLVFERIREELKTRTGTPPVRSSLAMRRRPQRDYRRQHYHIHNRRAMLFTVGCGAGARLCDHAWVSASSPRSSPPSLCHAV
jgi:hypothetical protein